MDQLRVPKINVPIICYTTQGEAISGEVFLDVILTQGYSINQLLDYFNARTPFFPILTSGKKKAILLQKESVVRLDVPQLLDQYNEETATFVTRKDAIVHFHTMGPSRVTVVVDLPSEHSRFSDLVNMTTRRFFPAIINDGFSLLNSNHIYKIEEI